MPIDENLGAVAARADEGWNVLQTSELGFSSQQSDGWNIGPPGDFTTKQSEGWNVGPPSTGSNGISAEPTVIDVGGSSSIKSTLTGQGINKGGVSVDLYVDGVIVDTGVTNSNGEVVFDYTFENSGEFVVKTVADVTAFEVQKKEGWNN